MIALSALEAFCCAVSISSQPDRNPSRPNATAQESKGLAFMERRIVGGLFFGFNIKTSIVRHHGQRRKREGNDEARMTRLRLATARQANIERESLLLLL